jgi:hypothetical protein
LARPVRVRDAAARAKHAAVRTQDGKRQARRPQGLGGCLNVSVGADHRYGTQPGERRDAALRHPLAELAGRHGDERERVRVGAQ